MRKDVQRWFAAVIVILTAFGGVVGNVAAAQDRTGEQGLIEIKAYLTNHVDLLVTGATDLNTWSEQYYAVAEASRFDYDVMWAAHKADLPAMLTEGRRIWTDEANLNYEMSEGLVAGVPSLASFDVWIDAGPTAAEDPTNAYEWTLELPDGQKLAKPGNLFHSITEPTLWGTEPTFTGLQVDFNGDGRLTLGEALPDANMLLGGTRSLLDASTQLQTAVAAWQPTLSDAFTALVVMIPTANGYFEQWRLSPFVSGEASESNAFVGASRLVDVLGIYGGLDVAWTQLGPLVETANPALANQISNDLTALVAFVKDIHDREVAGTRFTPEQAELYGRRVQTMADSVAGNIGQAAAVLDIEIQSI